MRSSDLKRSGRTRARLGRALALSFLLPLAACADEPTTPKARGGDGDGGGTPPRTLGLVEITISGLGSGQVTSSARSAPSVTEFEQLRARRQEGAAGISISQAVTLPDNDAGGANGTIQLELVSTGSFTDGDRGNGGHRYLYATYRVRNAQSDGTAYDTRRQNLAFYAVSTEGTLGETAISALKRFDGSAADPALASSFIPTGAAMQDVRGDVVSRFPDVLQVITEDEADAIEALAGEGVTDVFPWGFVVQNAYTRTSRSLPADPAEDEFDGVVTFAFKVPLQASASDDPFTVSMMFLAVDDDEVRITQSVEEQTPAGRAAFDASAAMLGADIVTLLPPSGDAMLDGGATVRLACDVRVAGPAGAPAATLAPSLGSEFWLFPSPFRAGPISIARDARVTAAGCPGIANATATTFAVHGFHGGRNVAGAYEDVGGQFVRAPAARGGAFFPGEMVEVTLTTDLGGTKPVVGRYRVATSGGSGTYQIAGGDSLRVGVGPYGVAIGDVNGDGALDLVAVNFNDDNVSVLLNEGDGAFESQVTYTVGDAPIAIALGDVDGDGDLDLVVANANHDNVSVLLNNGDGTFASHATYAAGDGPYSVALGDLDGDGDLDLATADYYGGTVSVLLNNGDGTFASHGTYVAGSLPTSIAIGDVDGDGDLDLVATIRNANSVRVLLNQGDATFTSPGTVRVGSGPLSVALGDLDGDGDLDLVTANVDGGNASVLFNDGRGTFTLRAAYPVGTMPWSVAIGDVDGDGDLDLIVANQSSSNVSVLRNHGNGSFGPQASFALLDLTRAVALGDLDGDGDLDMVVPRSSQSRVSVLFNQ